MTNEERQLLLSLAETVIELKRSRDDMAMPQPPYGADGSAREYKPQPSRCQIPRRVDRNPCVRQAERCELAS